MLGPSAVECQTCGLDEKSVRGIVGEFKTQLPHVEAMEAESLRFSMWPCDAAANMVSYHS